MSECDSVSPCTSDEEPSAEALEFANEVLRAHVEESLLVGAPEHFLEACRYRLALLFDPLEPKVGDVRVFGKAIRDALLIYSREPASTDETPRGISLRFLELAMVVVEDEHGGCGYEGSKREGAARLEEIRASLEELCDLQASFWWNYHLVESHFASIVGRVREAWVV